MPNPTYAAHPTADQLAAFDRGQLGPEQWAEIEAHVARCASCCRLLEGVEDDALAALVRASGGKAAAGPNDTGEWRPSADTPSPAWPDAEAPAELKDHPRYRLLGLLGAGGMGAVFKAEHRLMSRVVALKVINRALVARPEMVQRFRREVQAAARLNHPNVVAAHDAEQAGEAHFLVMEFVEGASLDRWLKVKGPLPVEEACDYVRQAALGLDHAFRHGMVHRDIKPQNLMRTPQGRVKVLDFGLATCFGAGATPGGLTPSGSVLGTPDYIAPEQALDPQRADIRADVYSLGCTLYHLLAGQPPFPTGTALQKLMAQREARPAPLGQFRPDAPPALARLLERMLAKDPAARPQTPAQVADELAAFVRALPVVEVASSAPAAPPPQPAAPSRATGGLRPVLPRATGGLRPVESLAPEHGQQAARGTGPRFSVAAAVLALLGVMAVAGVLVGLAASSLFSGGKGREERAAADSAKSDKPETDKKGPDAPKETPPPDGAGPTGVPIPAPNLTDSKLVVDLPEPFAQVRTGGGGRYLIFHLKKARKLAIFDVSEAKIVKEIEVPDDVLYAAGLDALMVVLPGQKLLYRWSFKTYDRSRGVPLPYDNPVLLAAMGPSSQGPLLLWSGGEVALWDVQKLEPMTVRGKLGSGDPTYGFQLRVSADGRTFVAWHGRISGQQYGLMHLEGERTSHQASPDGHTFNGHWAMPGPDARLIFRYGAGVYDGDFKLLTEGSFGKDAVLLPTEDPRFFLSVLQEPGDKNSVTICTASDRRPVYTIKGLEKTTGSILFTNWGLVGGEPRFRYLPSAKVFISLPETNDRVVLRPFDLDDELKRSGEKYLFVASVPPARVETASVFAYKLDVRSKVGGVKFHLDKGPDGMTISDNGLLTWNVPPRTDGKTFPVVVAVRDADGKEVFHTFDLPVVARARK
jgi:hypothetical protein